MTKRPTICVECKYHCYGPTYANKCLAPSVQQQNYVTGVYESPFCSAINGGCCTYYVPLTTKPKGEQLTIAYE